MHNVQCTMYNVKCTVYNVQCTVYNVQCTLYIVQCTMYNVQCTMCIVQCTMYNVQCTVYRVHCTVYSVQCTLYNVSSSSCWEPRPPQKFRKSHWCVPFTATFSKRRKIGALWSERCDATVLASKPHVVRYKDVLACWKWQCQHKHVLTYPHGVVKTCPLSGWPPGRNCAAGSQHHAGFGHGLGMVWIGIW